jgi:insecticidal toxin complex protein TccC
MNTSLFSNTPMVTVHDNRGLTVRDIAYHRHPDHLEKTTERITRHQYDPRGFPRHSTDPRLHNTGRTNFIYLTDLTGSVLRTQGADSGTVLTLNDAAGRPFIAVSNLLTTDDGTEDHRQAVTRTWQYEGSNMPGRPLSLTEQTPDGVSRITERFVYAGNTDAAKTLNLAGTCVSHYDTAGLTQTDSIALTGVPLSVTRRLLKDADNPDTVADWQGDDAVAWNGLLAGENERYTTLTTADATGAVLTTTDAKGNLQRVAYDVAGLLSGSWLTLKNSKEQVIVRSLTYSAAGQKLREVHGNGVVTTYEYEPETQRLVGIKTERPTGHTSGAKVLQDLRYEYDPVGNVLKVSNDAEETRFWRNQKVVPENTYTYDSLYQLVSATGREMANANPQSTGLPAATVPLPTDSAAFTNYTRTYTYDDAGNLTQIRHSAPATGNNHTTAITVSDRSNRGVLSTLTENATEVDALFTAGGQQTQLQPGQTLSWTPRNELLKVTPVVREGTTDDSESYRYDADSRRVLKVGAHNTGNSMQTQRVVYLPGLERRITVSDGKETESLQVITVGEAGRAQVRVLHWESGKPADISDGQVRYSYDNLIGSNGLELDGDGNIISQEEYYPYGGTAILTARSQAEVAYRTIRYSGKERDATGLYYYGYRYYQPWAGRWLSSDPAGTVDGLNLYRMCRNNPASLKDYDGRTPEKTGYIYAPFVAPDLLEQSGAINIIRHVKGKATYPVIVKNDEDMKKMEAIRNQKSIDLKSKVDQVSDALQRMDEQRRNETGWTPDYLRTTLSPDLFDKSLNSLHKFSQELSVVSRLEIISNENKQIISKLSPDRNKLYIIGHGGAGQDILAADQRMEHGMITAKNLVLDLLDGGLVKSFNDIRVTACYSADATKPVSFDSATLDKSSRPVVRNKYKFWDGEKTKSFAHSLRDELLSSGFSNVEVSGYHGAGVTFSQQENHTRRLPDQSDVRRSTVRRSF